LGVLTLFDRMRSRPIIRANANIAFCRLREKPVFVTAKVQTGSQEQDAVDHEIYVEFQARNYGNRPLSLHHIYIEDSKDNLSYITPDGLPMVLEPQSSAVFMIQKEFFDEIDVRTRERLIGDVIDTGFVDALDRRYPVPKKRLLAVLNESATLPTGKALYKRNDDPEMVGFQVVHSANMMRRSSRMRRRPLAMFCRRF
jgi:hypothetical protein